jgi:hypothetical protein
VPSVPRGFGQRISLKNFRQPSLQSRSRQEPHERVGRYVLNPTYGLTVFVLVIRLLRMQTKILPKLSLRGVSMAIYKLIANGSFGPDEIEVMKAAYEAALIDVGVTDRDDPITELIAKAIVNVTASGERNPKEVMERALNVLGVRRSAA